MQVRSEGPAAVVSVSTVSAVVCTRLIYSDVKPAENIKAKKQHDDWWRFHSKPCIVASKKGTMTAPEKQTDYKITQNISRFKKTRMERRFHSRRFGRNLSDFNERNVQNQPDIRWKFKNKNEQKKCSIFRTQNLWNLIKCNYFFHITFTLYVLYTAY